jgi:D-arabinose 1-dehydrogenase-like Zn-dependent alcohol dehydrogenase
LEKGTWQEEDTQVSEYVSKLESLSQEILDLKANLQAFVKRRAERNERVAVWGAGGKGIAVLAVTQLTGIAYVIDSDPNKQGRWTPVSDLPVVSPTALLAEPVDALIVTAMAYKDEIVHHLREEIAFKGEIVCLTDRLTVVT